MERNNGRLRIFKRYPEYKDLGVEWLGEIPAHWEVRPLKSLAPLSDDRSYEHNAELPYVGLENIKPWTGRLTLDESLESGDEVHESTASPFRSGDVLFGKLRPYLAKVLKASFDGVCSTELIVLRPVGHLVPEYLAYFLLNPVVIQFIDSLTFGTKMPRTSPRDIARLSVCFPSKLDQQGIATFLDRETARIDALIAKKERLIELLQEKRTALITHAVTKGLDPNVPMKDSGVEWLGEIPEHWRTKKLKFSVSFTGGGTPSKENPDYWKGDIPWVSPKDMKSEEVATTEDYITDAGLKESSTHLIQTACVLIVVRSGILKHTIPVAINQCEVALNQDMKALIPSSEINPSFLKLVILGNQKPFLAIWRKQGATVESIEHELLANTHVPLPPLIEQQHISAFIDLESEGINHLLEQVRVAIALLKEYRTALISAAVTGKIDVRDLV